MEPLSQWKVWKGSLLCAEKLALAARYLEQVSARFCEPDFSDYVPDLDHGQVLEHLYEGIQVQSVVTATPPSCNGHHCGPLAAWHSVSLSRCGSPG